MAGNVWEWCNDRYGRDHYSASPKDNPLGPDRGTPMPDGNPHHVVRGGSCYYGEYGHSRVANRNNGHYRGPDDPDHAWYHFGFRVARGTTGSQPEPTAQPEPTTAPEPDRTVGLRLNDGRASDGNTLFPPKNYTSTYLTDNEGQVVHSWLGSRYEPG